MREGKLDVVKVLQHSRTALYDSVQVFSYLSTDITKRYECTFDSTLGSPQEVAVQQRDLVFVCDGVERTNVLELRTSNADIGVKFVNVKLHVCSREVTQFETLETMDS